MPGPYVSGLLRVRRAALRAALGLWLRCAARLLGIADYLLPAPARAPAAPPAPPAPLLLGAAEGDAPAEDGGAGAGGGAQRAQAEAAPPAADAAQQVRPPGCTASHFPRGPATRGGAQLM